jgi:hypothetical protein
MSDAKPMTMFEALQVCTTLGDSWKLCGQEFEAVRVPQRGTQHALTETLKLAKLAANVVSIADHATERLGKPTEAQKMIKRMVNILESRKDLSTVAYKLWCTHRGYLDA